MILNTKQCLTWIFLFTESGLWWAEGRRPDFLFTNNNKEEACIRESGGDSCCLFCLHIDSGSLFQLQLMLELDFILSSKSVFVLPSVPPYPHCLSQPKVRHVVLTKGYAREWRCEWVSPPSFDRKRQHGVVWAWLRWKTMRSVDSVRIKSEMKSRDYWLTFLCHEEKIISFIWKTVWYCLCQHNCV